MCYHAEFRRSALKGVGINTGEPYNSGALKFSSLRMGAIADYAIRHTYVPPHICYHVKFGSSARVYTHE